jgi:cytochrome subunit of sulfide dehydrogenase
MKLRNLAVTGAALIVSVGSQAVHAADPNLGRNLAATCANCHGTNGKSVGGMESLAGLPKDKIVKNMKEFKSGDKPASIMHQLAKGYNDAQIDAIATFLSAQK